MSASSSFSGRKVGGRCEECDSAFEATAWLGVLRCKCNRCYCCSLCPAVKPCVHYNMEQHLASAGHKLKAAKVPTSQLPEVDLTMLEPKQEIVVSSEEDDEVRIPERVERLVSPASRPAPSLPSEGEGSEVPLVLASPGNIGLSTIPSDSEDDELPIAPAFEVREFDLVEFELRL